MHNIMSEKFCLGNIMMFRKQNSVVLETHSTKTSNKQTNNKPSKHKRQRSKTKQTTKTAYNTYNKVRKHGVRSCISNYVVDLTTTCVIHNSIVEYFNRLIKEFYTFKSSYINKTSLCSLANHRLFGTFCFSVISL